jgi:hypothetical protein
MNSVSERQYIFGAFGMYVLRVCVCLRVFICMCYWVSVFVDKWVVKFVDCFEFVKKARAQWLFGLVLFDFVQKCSIWLVNHWKKSEDLGMSYI